MNKAILITINKRLHSCKDLMASSKKEQSVNKQIALIPFLLINLHASLCLATFNTQVIL
jgi:hypothetical protein